MTVYPSGPPTEPITTCYRHGDRRAGVTCQRCNRPICPSCMVTASVGFQCPECAKAGAKQSRTISAGQVLGNRVITPVVTYTLIAINVAVFLIGIAVNRHVYTSFDGGQFELRWGQYTAAVANGEWYRLITSGFVHFGLIHIAMNMYVLYVVGPPLERLLGRSRFLIVYGASLLGGSLGALLLDGNGVSAGASGAIYGLFGALAVLELLRGQNPLRSQIGQVIGINLVLTVFLGFSLGGHVGGLLAGAAVAGILLAGKPLPAQAQVEQTVRGVAGTVLGLTFFGVALLVAQARYGIG